MLPARSQHAQARHQGRATNTIIEEWVLAYGTRVRSHGAEVAFIDKAARKRLRHALGGERAVRLLERHWDTYLVLADDGRIVTTSHRTRRIRRQWSLLSVQKDFLPK